MARRIAIPSEDVQLRIVGPTNVFKASRVQRVTFNSDVPTTDVNELGNSSLAGTVQDIPNVTATFSAFDVGIKVFGTLAGKDITAFPAGGASISDLGSADIVVDVQDAVDMDYIKAAHGRKLQVRDFSFSYSVDGESTEDYNLIGSKRRWFKNDVVIERFVSGGTSFVLAYVPLVLKNGDYALSVILDGEYLVEVTGVPGTGEYAVNAGTRTVTTGDASSAQVLVVYHANPAGNAWTDVLDADVPAAIRGRDVKVKISANDISRVQNVTINGNLNVQPVKEMGEREIAGYQAQVPTVEGTITVLDTDVELLSLLTTGTLSGAGVYEYEVGQQCPTSGVSLTVELLDPCDETYPLTVLKTVYIDEIIPTGDSWTSNVNNNATQTFNWRAVHAHLVVYSGAM